jgi:hypothetical protein
VIRGHRGTLVPVAEFVPAMVAAMHIRIDMLVAEGTQLAEAVS